MHNYPYPFYNHHPIICLLLFIGSFSPLGAIDPLPLEQRRNGSETLQAFEESSKASLSSTVRLVSKGRTLALGTIVSRKGHIITKASSSIEAEEAILADGPRYKVQAKGKDKETDLAVFKIKGAKKLTPVSWAEEVLQARDRTQAAMTFSPNGLYLVDVDYPQEHDLPKNPLGPFFLSELLL